METEGKGLRRMVTRRDMLKGMAAGLAAMGLLTIAPPPEPH